MVSKTRRKNQKGRGNTRKRRGGAIYRLRNVTDAMTLAEFERLYDVFYISAHGGLESKEFSVPKDTYLLHSIPSTFKCFLAANDTKLDRFYQPEDKYNTSNAYGLLEDGEEHFMKFIKNPKIVFPHIYNKSQLSEIVKFTNNRFAEVTSIYEPDDFVNDVLLQFYSYSVEPTAAGGITHFIAPGIFKIPMSYNIKRIRDEYLFTIQSMRGVPKDVIDAELKAKDTKFINLKGNLIKSIIERERRREFKLSSLLKMPELQAAPGKKRLLIIHACKSTFANNTTKKQIRRQSLSRFLYPALFKNNNELPPTEFVPRSVLVNTATPTWNNMQGLNMFPADGQIVINTPPPPRTANKKKEGLKRGFLL